MANRKITKDISDFVIAGAVLGNFYLNKLDRLLEWGSKTTVVVKGSNNIPINIGEYWYMLDTDITLSTASDMDTGSISNGKDYYVYLCENAGSIVGKISLASTYPSGFTAATSRKIGGFHTLCTNVGTIGGHTLSGYLANEILPQSVWDLKHRCKNGKNEGMVYSSEINKWVQIYLAADDGASGVKSVNGATILDTIDWNDFVDKGAKVGMRLLDDDEFQAIAAGSNEETNITGSADPVTTGGHIDTASRRMISNIGCEDVAGALWQWLRTPSAKLDDGTVAYTKDLPGAKGSFYTYGTNGYGNTQLLAGGAWADGATCGSRSRNAADYRWNATTSIGGRFLAEPL